MAKDNEIREYSLMRVILILMVLFGHIVIHQSWHPLYGGVRFDDMLLSAGYPDSQIHIIMVRVALFIYQFHMAAFLALSGALFRLTIGRYHSIIQLIKKKGLRLLVPFFLVTLFYVAPIKYFTGCFVPGVSLKVSILNGLLLLRGNNYLWYLPVLFLVTVLVYLLEKIHIHPYVKLLVVLLLHESRFLFPSLLYMTFEDLLWFYSGFLFEDSRPEANHFIMRHKYFTLIAWIILLLARILTVNGKLSSIQTMIYHLTAFTGMFAVYSTAVILSCTAKRASRFISMISANGMGIYIYSDPLNYIITYQFVTMFGICALSSNKMSGILLLIKMFSTLFVPIILCKALRRLHLQFLT